MQPVTESRASATPQTGYYQAVLPKQDHSLTALEVAKWGFIELVVMVIAVSLLRKRNRPRPSKSSF